MSTFNVAGKRVGLLTGGPYAIGAAMVPHCATFAIIQRISCRDDRFVSRKNLRRQRAAMH